MSEKNYYLGLSLQYQNAIKYCEDEPKDFVKMDRDKRFAAMEQVMDSHDALRKECGAAQPDPARASAAAAAAKRGVNRWLGLVPGKDVEEAVRVFNAVRAADADRNRALSDEELATLPERDAAMWKRRVEHLGN